MKWILWSRQTEKALVIIPEEAEELIPILRSMPCPSTHLILYAAPATKRMLHFNRLDYYALPSFPVHWVPPEWLQFELGILAGRLYFELPEYSLLLDRFNLTFEGESGHLSEAGSNARKTSAEQQLAQRFLKFVQDWLALRRQGQDISHTPMGYVCQGWKLRTDHPFFSTKDEKGDTSEPSGPVLHSEYHTAQDEDEEYYDSDGIEEELEDYVDEELDEPEAYDNEEH